VWSIQESKDIASTGKSLKPHCIQILCILRLLSVDKDSKGVDKHLAQVLTGQGKSLVLGLLSSLLALTGHRVRTVCYSKYLATRDEQDFDDFFKQFGIRDKITYGTFEEMANEVLQCEVNGEKQGLRDLVKDRILNHSEEHIGQIKQEDISSTILLIDEVDVFFSDQFYGNTYYPITTIDIPALASIQEKIWEIASTSTNFKNEVEEFINKNRRERNQDFKDFHKFRLKRDKYYLLKEKDKVAVIEEYSNDDLYEEHLDKMIDSAINVAKGNDKDWYVGRYKLNDDGRISYRRDDGIYCIYTYYGYYNIFNYFRLKKKDFDRKNYGYLNIGCGKVSYAKLPEKYPLILGVSGTLSTLNDYERSAVREYYNINENSIMPSYFGRSNLTFNKNSDFVSQDSEEEWLNKIFSHANSEVDKGKSVLIFFDTDVEIDKFKTKFLRKFDRLYTLTENTQKQIREKYIDEASITKTITLATRGMGRGVDFKSSVGVERNGGVHVIQTFFSLDIKEETQIKGRTARKDNKGSYELILCKEHLIDAGFMGNEETAVGYQKLNEAREVMSKEKGSNNAKRIKESQVEHETTMKFFESFFKKQNVANFLYELR
jgi:preprotein translocase subunit SecA